MNITIHLRIKLMAALIILLSLIGAISIPILVEPVSAHRSGCHRWHSCPSDSGSYNCGDTGYSNYCGTPTYSAPTITVKDEVVEQIIPSKIITKENSNEYIGYKKLISNGNPGKQTSSTSVTYTDGVESSRGEPTVSTVTPQVSTTYEVGTRVKPTAYIDYLSKSDNQSFWSFFIKEYDISASAQPNGKYALIKNDQVVRLGSSSNTGMLNFENVGVRSDDKLAIGTYSGEQFLLRLRYLNHQQLIPINLRQFPNTTYYIIKQAIESMKRYVF
jgi:hypothetical protein